MRSYTLWSLPFVLFPPSGFGKINCFHNCFALQSDPWLIRPLSARLQFRPFSQSSLQYALHSVLCPSVRLRLYFPNHSGQTLMFDIFLAHPRFPVFLCCFRNLRIEPQKFQTKLALPSSLSTFPSADSSEISRLGFHSTSETCGPIDSTIFVFKIVQKPVSISRP